MGNPRLNTMVGGETIMKFYPQVLTCGNCRYTRANSEWYTSKKLRFFIALRIAILQKSTVLIVGGMKMVRLM